jgi:hypothetical protein
VVRVGRREALVDPHKLGVFHPASLRDEPQKAAGYFPPGSRIGKSGDNDLAAPPYVRT